MSSPEETTVRRFLAWMDAHGAEPAVFTGGLLQSKGCEPLPPLPDPGCCSKHVDLCELADVLRELVS